MQGPYCHRCGQHDIDFKRSFWHVAMEALETWFHFDGKLLHSVSTLLLRPGRLTREFLEGKRASQVPPFRLYFFVSVLFFAWIHYHGSDVKFEASLSPGAGRIEAEGSAHESPGAAAAPDGAASERPAHSGGAATTTSTEQAVIDKLKNPTELREEILHLVPRMLLACLPLFAVLTRLASRKSGWAYLQHLVIAFHLHTFVFIIWVLGDLMVMGMRLLSESAASWLDAALLAYGIYWVIAATKHIFGGTWGRTLARTAAVGLGYSLILLLGILTVVSIELLH